MSLRAAARRTINAALSSLSGTTPTAGRILLYHEIRADPDPIMCVPPALFRAQLDWLAERGLRGAAISTCRREGYAPGMVGVSFDDGYASAASACEELLGRGWTATLFVVPGWIDEGRDGVLGWRDLTDLAGSGVEIASHGLSHDRPCGRPVAQIAAALSAARARIEDRLGAAAPGFAYPFGLAPARAREAARLAGHAYACTSEPGRNRVVGDPYRLRRNEVLGTDARPRLLLAKLAGSDDWMGPVRAFENGLGCR